MRSNSPYPTSRLSSPRLGVVSPSFTLCPSRSCSNSPTPRAVVNGLLDSSNQQQSEGSWEERRQLLEGEGTGTTVYSRRWYLLLVFSLVGLLQTLMWATWGPIAQSAEAAFSWDDSNIAMCLWMGNVPFALLCIPLSWLMDHKGLRVAMVLTSVAMTTGAGLRCLVYFVPQSYFVWCIYSGQLLNGVAGPVAQGGGALFSNLWFPSNQRATATAISTFVGYMGNAIAFALGPALVPVPPDDSGSNGSLPSGNGTLKQNLQKLMSDSNNGTVVTGQEELKEHLTNYLFYQAVGTVVVLVMVVVYFPDKPPLPPTRSAAIDREAFKPGLLKLVKNKQFWLISAAFCLSLGVFETWDIALDANLNNIGISQDQAGWLGFSCVLAGCVAGLVISRLADIFFRQIRLFLIISYIVSAAFVLWFTLIYIGVLPLDLVSIYAAVILSGVFLDGCCPLVYELVCEAAYPVGEGVSSCFLQMLFVLAGIAFTSVQEIPNIGTTWMNWCLLGSLCVAVPLLFGVTDTFGRAELDAMDDQVIVIEPPENPSTQQDHIKYNPIQQTHDPGYGSCQSSSYLPNGQHISSYEPYHSQPNSFEQNSRHKPYTSWQTFNDDPYHNQQSSSHEPYHNQPNSSNELYNQQSSRHEPYLNKQSSSNELYNQQSSSHEPYLNKQSSSNGRYNQQSSNHEPYNQMSSSPKPYVKKKSSSPEPYVNKKSSSNGCYNQQSSSHEPYHHYRSSSNELYNQQSSIHEPYHNQQSSIHEPYHNQPSSCHEPYQQISPSSSHEPYQQISN